MSPRQRPSANSSPWFIVIVSEYTRTAGCAILGDDDSRRRAVSSVMRCGGLDLISFCEAVEIAADKERVWRALTLPDEVIRWDTGIVESLDAPSDYPLPGQHVRWRYRFGPFPLTLHDRPSEVVACSRLRTSIRLGFFDFDEIYMLSESESSGTRLEAELFLSSRIPVVGRLLECVVGVPLSRSTVRTSLVAIRAHCERAP